MDKMSRVFETFFPENPKKVSPVDTRGRGSVRSNIRPGEAAKYIPYRMIFDPSSFDDLSLGEPTRSIQSLHFTGLGLGNRWAFAPADILLLADGFEVIGVDTRRITAQVIYY